MAKRRWWPLQLTNSQSIWCQWYRVDDAIVQQSNKNNDAVKSEDVLFKSCKGVTVIGAVVEIFLNDDE